LQCVAECCSVLQSVAVCCRVLQCVAECCSVLQRVAVCCRVCCRVLQCVAECCRVCCSVLQSVAVCCRVLQCVATHEWDPYPIVARYVCSSQCHVYVCVCCSVYVCVCCSVYVCVCCSVMCLVLAKPCVCQDSLFRCPLGAFQETTLSLSMSWSLFRCPLIFLLVLSNKQHYLSLCLEAYSVARFGRTRFRGLAFWFFRGSHFQSQAWGFVGYRVGTYVCKLVCIYMWLS